MYILILYHFFWGWDRGTASDTLQTTFSNSFSLCKLLYSNLISLISFLGDPNNNKLPSVHNDMISNRQSHYLNHWWPSYASLGPKELIKTDQEYTRDQYGKKFKLATVMLPRAISGGVFCACVVFMHPWPKTACCWGAPGLILGLHPANERRRYFVTTSLIGWDQA